MPPISRRALVSGSAALGGGLLLPRRARATVSAVDRKFVFVFANGGWDVTRVYADLLDNADVATEGAAAISTAGGIRFVDHPDRPSVRTFFQNWHARSLILNGYLVPAISHELCTSLSLTGGSSGAGPDWPAILGSVAEARYTIPHLVAGGPAFSGDLGALVARTGTNGQLQGLLDGNIRELSDVTPTEPLSGSRAAIDAWLRGRLDRRRASAWAGKDRELADAFGIALDKADALKAMVGSVDFSSGATLEDQAQLAVEALGQGIARCVSAVFPGILEEGTWDSHSENDSLQSSFFESLFTGLNILVAGLAATPGTAGETLLDETVVVVLSEMGRSPQLNALEGKDHWPYTSALLVGSGITGDRVVGGWDPSFYGSLMDPLTGELDAAGEVLDVQHLGATLLALGDVDPGEHLDGGEPILGIME